MKAHSKVRTRWIIAGFVGIAISLLVGRHQYIASADARDWTRLTREEGTLNKTINQVLPIGTEKSKVEEFLRTQHIEFMSYPRGWIVGDDSVPQVEAYTRPVKVRLGRCTIHLTFDFDMQNRLSKYREEHVCAE